MTTSWLLAKYMGDLRRREPINIGIVLHHRGLTLARFFGEATDGSRVVDGRVARGRVASVPTYRSWIKHWRRELELVDDELTVLLTRTAGENYYLEPGGTVLLQGQHTDALNLLNDLFTTLVHEPDAAVSMDIRQLVAVAFAAAPRVQRQAVHEDVVLNVPIDNGMDELRFNYRYDNGRPHLLQRISLSTPDKRTWNMVHAAAYQFNRAQDAPELDDPHFVALVKPREFDAALEGQLRVLEQHAAVVDVSSKDAPDQLADLLEPVNC